MIMVAWRRSGRQPGGLRWDEVMAVVQIGARDRDTAGVSCSLFSHGYSDYMSNTGMVEDMDPILLRTELLAN